MTAGRTSWWPKDAAWHRRELLIELGEEFGAEGPHLIDVLSAWAQEQGATGEVKGGWRGLARESFVALERCKEIVSRSVTLGVLDDFEASEDGRRFTLRVSGWSADARRGRAAWRQANKRERDSQAESEASPDVTERDLSRSVTESAPQDRTGQDKNNTRGAIRFGGRIVPAARVAVAEEILDDFNQREGTSYRTLTAAGKTTEEFKRILSAVVDHPDLDAEFGKHVNATGLAGPRRFWEGKAQPGHVWGKMTGQNLERARAAGPQAAVDEYEAMRRHREMLRERDRLAEQEEVS